MGVRVTVICADCTVCSGLSVRKLWMNRLYNWLSLSHFENTHIQIYTENFTTKNWKFSDKKSDIFHISAQNIYCGYSLEPPRRGGSNEYPQFMVLSRNKKNNVYPVNPSFTTNNLGLRGSKLYRYVFVLSRTDVSNTDVSNYCFRQTLKKGNYRFNLLYFFLFDSFYPELLLSQTKKFGPLEFEMRESAV